MGHLREKAKKRSKLSPTGFKTETGREIYRVEGGGFANAKEITVTDERLNKGRPTNIPSIWGGAIRSNKESVRRASKSGQRFRYYGSIGEAVDASKKKSKSNDATLRKHGLR